MPNLTAEFMLNDAKPPVKGRTFYWDDKLKGFGLMVTASGHKTFVVQYRVRGQSRRMATAGFHHRARGGTFVDGVADRGWCPAVAVQNSLPILPSATVSRRSGHFYL
jgi:hypothetical protein